MRSDEARFDEMWDGGAPRPHWRAFWDRISSLPEDMWRERARFVREALAADGVTYNVHAEAGEVSRPWELDFVPLLVPEGELRVLSAGVAQRARLLNAILKDLYGPQRALREGLLPPALVFGQRAFLWPLCGVAPPQGVFLHLLAVDVARGPDGRFWVIGDRTQGLSGAAYALQNRAIVARALPDLLRDLGVLSLGPFFSTLLSSLGEMAPGRAPHEAPLVVLLTPGPESELYFEHLFLARHLGLPLVLGQDLIVRQDVVFLKTLYGLRRVHAVLRTTADEDSDPVELRADAIGGVPGLVAAVRAGHVLVANALGSAVVETCAMHSFLPALCERLLGEPLALPPVAGHWCGDPPRLSHACKHLGELVVKATYPSMRRAPVFGHTLSEKARAEMIASLTAQPHAYVAQERVQLSRAPVWAGSGSTFVGRPLALRLFAVARGNDYVVMPGALARVARSEDGDLVSLLWGGSSKDTWVVPDNGAAGALSQRASWNDGGEAPPNPDALRASWNDGGEAPPNPDALRASWDDGGESPVSAEARSVATAAFESSWDDPVPLASRIGENLFWMGRYSERCEATTRLLRAALGRVGDAPRDGQLALRALRNVAAHLGVLPPADGKSTPDQDFISAVTDRQSQGGLFANVERLTRSASHVRERMSTDNWHVLSRLRAKVPEPQAPVGALLASLDEIMVGCVSLAGFAMDDMTRDESWRFLILGRHVERLSILSGLVGRVLGLAPRERDAALEGLIEVANSTVTYRARYRRAPEILSTLRLVVLDGSNPHAVSFQVTRLLAELDQVARDLGRRPKTRFSALEQALSDIDVRAEGACPRIVELLEALRAEAFSLSDALHRLFFSHAGALAAADAPGGTG